MRVPRKTESARALSFMLELKTHRNDKSNNKFNKGTTIPAQSMIRRFIIEINRNSTVFSLSFRLISHQHPPKRRRLGERACPVSCLRLFDMSKKITSNDRQIKQKAQKSHQLTTKSDGMCIFLLNSQASLSPTYPLAALCSISSFK